MKFSHVTERIGGEGAQAWAVHFEAMRRRRKGEANIILSVGEPNFDTPPAIVAAAKDALDRGRTHYTDVVGDPPLRAAIATYHSKRSGQPVGPENVVVVAGAQCALFSAARRITARFWPGGSARFEETAVVKGSGRWRRTNDAQ